MTLPSAKKCLGIMFGFFYVGLALGGTPQRIASLSLASDEILLELAKSCGSSKNIIALSTFADDPNSSHIVNEAKDIKGRIHSEPESLLRLKPDLVIGASFNRQELLTLIRKKNIPLLYLEHFDSALDIALHIRQIGQEIACKVPAEKMANKFLDEVSSPAKTKTPLTLLTYSDDLTLWGKDTLIDDLIHRAGGENIASAKGLKKWPRVDQETLRQFHPDFILVLEKESPETLKKIKQHPIWKHVDAVKKENILFISPRSAMSTSHHFAKAVEELRGKLENARSVKK